MDKKNPDSAGVLLFVLMIWIKRSVCLPYSVCDFGEFVGGSNEGDHLGFAFRDFLLVEVLEDIWVLDGDTGTVVKEGTEYLISSFGDISLSMDGSA